MTNEPILDELLRRLLAENGGAVDDELPREPAEKRKLLRTLFNTRPPIPAAPDLLGLQDEFLSAEREAKGVIDANDLPSIREDIDSSGGACPGSFRLWQGDITTLRVDAIVNAANSKLLGCFVPHHRCIDNAIHSVAGVQLRLECNELMQNQGFDEPTGQAKLTRGCNLPSRYVLHTVGPIIHDRVSEADKALLASCYTTCLNRAVEQRDINSIAFCCISTGEFRFPKRLAAHIAVTTVCEWFKSSSRRLDRIIFNVFSNEDYDIYAAVFRKGVASHHA
ncbi:MAG TPA: protein-ADP-ribose hydrolase [Methylomirabilota bacterium]|nr:protein-ADP-ribose hydrolase [Methylomirabilota bacterium]